MKKLVSVLLTLCLCMTAVLLLASCSDEHEHAFEEAWSKDETHHWHACEDEDCSDVSDKAEHDWDEGEITTEATDSADGVLTYTCKDCEQTKTEAVSFNGVSLTQYGAAIEAATFNNVTISTVSVSGAGSDQTTTRVVYKLEGNKYVLQTTITTAAGTQTTMASDENDEDVASYKKTLLFVTRVPYDKLTYDATTQVYTVASDCVITVTMDDGSTVTYQNIKLKMSAEKISSVEAQETHSFEDAEDIVSAVTFSFSSYGTTVAADIGLAEEDLLNAIDLSNVGNIAVTKNGSDTTLNEIRDELAFLADIAYGEIVYDAETQTYSVNSHTYNGVEYTNIVIHITEGKISSLEYEENQISYSVTFDYDTVSGGGGNDDAGDDNFGDNGDGDDGDVGGGDDGDVGGGDGDA